MSKRSDDDDAASLEAYGWMPTARLRYINRFGQPVLQQLWTLGEYEKWADVPLEEFP